ncbi:inner membrane transport protein [Bradyrhizobium oligotrophicum S58]|uniref:Inner membrane transport protein n=1 Tax=Bradyrhizobium oligotrophicum S58 TaxID=1245469 RepID=M4ZGC1_9BRAD|nr:DMT family transporter [Bradyrhizobium oligotrophicum]BAM92897.1 inner membrane transport protein [Bradyrhizobium oligotrophicum S58]
MKGSVEGWGSGALGMTIFSGSLPATRAALEGFAPLFLTGARATLAAVLAALCLTLFRQPLPGRRDLPSLGIVSLGVVIGFPLLTALALRHITSAHAIVFIGLLPLSTAMFGVLRGGERPRPLFWLFAVLGAAAVSGFALSQDDAASPLGDLAMIAAVIVCGLGYAEGAMLTRRLGGWQVISWALVLSAPVMLLLSLMTLPAGPQAITAAAWLGLAYVSVFSMFIGFAFWYRGLARGGTATVGQLQLLQPFLGLAFASLLLHEPVSATMLGAAGAVVLCVALARRWA